eukprot:3377183-Pleurochrysis_carterae.AAC.2
MPSNPSFNSSSSSISSLSSPPGAAQAVAWQLKATAHRSNSAAAARNRAAALTAPLSSSVRSLRWRVTTTNRNVQRAERKQGRPSRRDVHQNENDARVTSYIGQMEVSLACMTKPHPLRAAGICMCMTAIALQITLTCSVSLDHQRRAGSMGRPDYSSASAGCIKLRYHPSQWEEFWMKSMNGLVISDRKWRERCKLMKDSTTKIKEWLNLSKSWQAAEQLSQVALLIKSGICSESTCSHRVIVDVCAGTEIGRIPIEPLVGDTRHPNGSCTGSFSQMISKDHLMPLPGPIHIEAHSLRAGPRTFFFDLGASTYTKGAGGASQSWFIAQYQKLGIHFDRVFAWEAMRLSPHAIFGKSQLPEAVFDSLSYYNVPISAEVRRTAPPKRRELR